MINIDEKIMISSFYNIILYFVNPIGVFLNQEFISIDSFSYRYNDTNFQLALAFPF